MKTRGRAGVEGRSSKIKLLYFSLLSGVTLLTCPAHSSKYLFKLEFLYFLMKIGYRGKKGDRKPWVNIKVFSLPI